MSPPPLVVRRLVVAPVVWVLAIAAVVVGPIAILVAFLVDVPERGSLRTTRLVLLGLVFCALEIVLLPTALVVTIVGRLRRRPDVVQGVDAALLAWWLGRITAAMRRFLGFQLEVDFADTGDAPLIVLSRHAGPGDALLLMDLLANGHGRPIRAIGRTSLLWDPFFDIIASTAGYLFLDPADSDTGERIRRAAAMPPRGAFISFPEGGNFTAARQHRAQEELRRTGRTALAEQAELLRHLLLPRPGGVGAAMEGAPDSTVVFVAHTGHEDVDSFARLWRAVDAGRTIHIEARVARRPRDWQERDVLREWLLRCWTEMDDWIHERFDG